MTYEIKIRTENAAFEDPGEVRRVLDRIATLIEGGQVQDGDTHWVHDTNGNRCGEVRFS